MNNLNGKFTNAMMNLAKLKEYYKKTFINNNEIPRKIFMIDDLISNYNFLQEFYNFEIQQVNLITFLIKI